MSMFILRDCLVCKDKQCLTANVQMNFDNVHDGSKGPHAHIRLDHLDTSPPEK